MLTGNMMTNNSAKSTLTADGYYMPSTAVPNLLTLPSFFQLSSASNSSPCFFRDYAGIGGDPRVDDWFLMKSPVLVMTVIAFYVILLGRLGRRIMRSFQPLEFLKPIIILYNITMLAMNGYIMLEIFDANRTFRYSWWCEPLRYGTDKQSMRIAAACHLFAITKLIEFLDTMFIIALKNWRQLSFLHLFHHSSMLANGWMIARFFAAATPALSVMVNSGIHTMMYTYYALAAIASSLQTKRLQSVLYKIKKYITVAQMIQFMVGFSNGINAWFILGDKCVYPKWLKVLGVLYTMTMMGLFSNFYYYAYIKRRLPRPTEEKDQSKLGLADKTLVLDADESANRRALSEESTVRKRVETNKLKHEAA